MGKHIDLSGKRFGRLVVTNEFFITKEGRRKWKCLCDCGNYIEVEYGTFKDTLAKWNPRPAPPVGRCKDCKFYTSMSHCQVHSLGLD